MLTHIQACAHAHTHTNAHAHTHTHTQHVHMHTHVHTCMHTCTHTHTHTQWIGKNGDDTIHSNGKGAKQKFVPKEFTVMKQQKFTSHWH